MHINSTKRSSKDLVRKPGKVSQKHFQYCCKEVKRILQINILQ